MTDRHDTLGCDCDYLPNEQATHEGVWARHGLCSDELKEVEGRPRLPSAHRGPRLPDRRPLGPVQPALLRRVALHQG